MNATEVINVLMGDREDPRYQSTPVDELRVYTLLVQELELLGPRIAAHTTSAVGAAYHAQMAERAHRATGYAQLAAADLAQRTLAHELSADTLNQVNELLADPSAFTDSRSELPADPTTPPQGRPTFKDTTDFLKNYLHLGFFEARERIRSATLLFPHTDVNGIDSPAPFPLLGKALADGSASPKDLADAARKLERLQPEIKQHPNPAELCATLEAEVADSVRTDDPLTTKQLFKAIQVSLEHGVTEPSEEVQRTKLGAFFRGTEGGISEYLLRLRAADSELLLAFFAEIDNPRTKAGDREALARQAATSRGSSQDPDGSHEPIPAKTPSTLPDFPDFLMDPATGQPLIDPQRANDLALDPQGTPFVPGGLINGTNYGADGLTPPQRHLQGLMNLFKANARAGNGRKTAGLPSPQMVIVTTLAELEGRAEQSGLTAHGQRLTPAELRQQLCNSGVIPVIMGGKSQILDLGREERYFPDYMRVAILALYGGCIMPGCTVPPEHCEIDHDKPWELGGTTEINAGRPLCSNHHHARHTGLISVVRDLDGLFSVILPKFMDPEQKPRRNTYWRRFPGTPPLF